MQNSVVKSIFVYTFFLSAIVGHSAFAQSQKNIFSSKDYIQAIHAISEVMIHDVVPPTGASRYYAYITISGYELLSKSDSGHVPDFKNKLNDFPDYPSVNKPINLSLAIIYSTIETGEELLPSGYLLDSMKQAVLEKAKSNLDAAVFKNTMMYADSFARKTVQYAGQDHYREINGLVKYTPKKIPGSWQPTPPAYMSAVDPYWNKIRPFILDSASQFKPLPCAAYSLDSTSLFYKQAKEVYKTGLHLTNEQKAIAGFWDCNPFAVLQSGHVDYGLKKISPAGHWMGIAGIACLKKNLPLSATVQVHTILAIAMADAFISCWDEKYSSNRIRPETFINEKIDRNWRPFLQTPPFPEYPSGHSVASNAAAVILSKLIGDPFSYTDGSEIEFGLPARSFSFL